MRVLLLHDAPHILGGATVYLRQLLAETGARGVENHLFRLDGAPAGLPVASETAFQYRDPGSAWRRRRDFHRYHAPLAAAVHDCLATVQPDLIHVQNCAVFRSTFFDELGKTGLPVVFTVHDYSLEDPNPFGHPRHGLRGMLQHRLDLRSRDRARTAVLKATTLFLCPTEALRRGLRLPPSRSRLLRLPIQPAEASPAPSDRLRLFFAGTLYRSKGVDLLLEALARARGPAQGAFLEIAGAGDQRAALEEQVERLELSERVRFLGLLDAAEMDAAYRRANLQVLPSRVPENSPLTVLEAGARGRPALASAAGGVPELLAEGRGYPFPSEDVDALARALEGAAEDLHALAATGAKMRAWVRECFDPERHWQALLAAYQEVCR